MKKEELIRLKDGYKELAEHYRLQANLKITEESRETSLKLAKRYEELDEIINREIPMTPHVEEEEIGIFYTCPTCSEQFVAESGETVNYCWNCGQRLTEKEKRRDKNDGANKIGSD